MVRGIMKVRRMLPLILIASACYNPEEHDIVSESGVVKIRVADNSVVGAVSGVPDGRALCSLGNLEFMVASGTGSVYRFDSQGMALDTSFSVGFGSGSGYRDMIIPKPGSVYLIGGAGRIVEVSLAGNSVAAEFQVGSLPSAMCASQSVQRFYVADEGDCRIREVDATTNTVLRQTEPLGAAPVAVAAESYLKQSLLAVCGDEAGTVGRVALNTFHVSPIYIYSPGSDLSIFPADTVWAVTHPDWSADNGRVAICSNFYMPEVVHVQIAGHPTSVCSVPGTTLFYVLSYLGSGTSRVTAVNYVTEAVVSEIDIAGFPWDITSHANGEFVLALTSGL